MVWYQVSEYGAVCNITNNLHTFYIIFPHIITKTGITPITLNNQNPTQNHSNRLGYKSNLNRTLFLETRPAMEECEQDDVAVRQSLTVDMLG